MPLLDKEGIEKVITDTQELRKHDDRFYKLYGFTYNDSFDYEDVYLETMTDIIVLALYQGYFCPETLLQEQACDQLTKIGNFILVKDVVYIPTSRLKETW
jgi:hypothetical protein